MDAETLARNGRRAPLGRTGGGAGGPTRRAGISGVVASPHEAGACAQRWGRDVYIVTPGVRPAGAEAGDQSRVATPAFAFGNGASHIVVGRPVTQAADPVPPSRPSRTEL